MPADTHKFFCTRCTAERTFRRLKVNHRFHLIISIVTGGLWLISWLGVVVARRFQPWYCSICGIPQAPPPKPPPKW